MPALLKKCRPPDIPKVYLLIEKIPLCHPGGSYRSFRPRLEELSIATHSGKDLPKEARGFFLNTSLAGVIWYVADMTQLGASYLHPESLAWRDSGVLIAMHALVAEYLGYAYCPLGITGVDEAQYLSDQREFMGVGLALVGSAV